MSFRLSVCIIARNERLRLPNALRSVRGVADEIVVTDTGSTDDTCAIAESFGARVSHFAWMDDFSAAYNHCFERAKGDWILSLDADEELLGESQSPLLAAVAGDRAFAYFVQRQDLVDGNSTDEFTEVTMVRLWRNHPDVRYVGRIHSQFAQPLASIAGSLGQQVLGSEIRIRHYGYAIGGARAKLDRSIRLLEMELRDRPEQFYYLVELGRTRLASGDARGIGDLRKAAEMVARRELQAMAGGGALAMLLESILAADELPPDFPLSWSQAQELALELFPDAVPLLWHIARRRFNGEQFEACARLLERIVRLGDQDVYDRSVSFCPTIMYGRALLNLGVCYVRLARLDEGEECFMRLAADRHWAVAASDNLAEIQRLRRV